MTRLFAKRVSDRLDADSCVAGRPRSSNLSNIWRASRAVTVSFVSVLTKYRGRRWGGNGRAYFITIKRLAEACRSVGAERATDHTQ